MKKNLKKCIKFILILVVIINLIAISHAYKFTHYNVDAVKKTKDPKQLTKLEKIKTAILGIDNPRPQNTTKPSKLYEEINVSIENQNLNCWFVPVLNSKGIILLFHGYSGNKSKLVSKSDVFNKLGYSTVLVDFLGSGNSSGNTTTIGFVEADQVKAVYDYFSLKYQQKISCFGMSMGSVALMKAINDYNIKPNAVILECPFGNMMKTVEARFNLMNIPTFPMANLLVFWGGTLNNFNAFDHNPEEYAKGIKSKTMVIYGKKDKRVSLAEIENIYANLNGVKDLKVYENANHNDLMEANEIRWKNDIVNFLDSKTQTYN